jgi:hypothetical protein
MIRGSMHGKDTYSSLLYGIQTGSVAHIISHPMDTGEIFPGSKAAGA